MDIRDRVMGDRPNSFFHTIAGIVPGFKGYMERERRRDADKLLRTHLARQYSDGRARLARVQQAMVRARQLDHIAEVDRVAGVLQRFIDRLNVATYGYTGLFDPVKIEEQDLDMLYAFDMSLTAGVEQLSGAVSAVESAAAGGEREEVSAALARLSALADELNSRLDQRQDFISTGRGLPQDEYNRMLSGINQATAGPQGGMAGHPAPGASEVSPYTAPPPPYGQAGSGYTGAPTMPTGQSPAPSPYVPPQQGSGNEMARVQGGGVQGGGMQDRPETPRSETSETGATTQMGRLDEAPPIEQWPSAPSPFADDEREQGGTASGAAGYGGHTAGRTSGSTTPGGFGSGGESAAGGEPGTSERAGEIGMGQGRAGSSYSSRPGDDTGIESASSPTVPGADVADNPTVYNSPSGSDMGGHDALDDGDRHEDKA